MGRYYHGTINGKWSFGVLESDTPSVFHPTGYKTTYRCPYGDADTGDDTFFDDVWPENVDDPSTWDDDNKEFMDTHGECLKAKKVCCFITRDDCLTYEFDRDEHYGYVVEQMKKLSDELPGLSIHFAHYDFNDLCEVTSDQFEDEEGNEVSLLPFLEPTYPPQIENNIKSWPSFGQRLALLIYDYASQIWAKEMHDPSLSNLTVCRDCDPSITGNPLEPVCCRCRTLHLDEKFDKKQLGSNQRYSNVYNPFKFDGEVWRPGTRFQTNGPFLCSSCNKHRFWNPLVPRGQTQIYYIENIRDKFIHAVSVWSFGEQLRQALFHGDVFLESET